MAVWKTGKLNKRQNFRSASLPSRLDYTTARLACLVSADSEARLSTPICKVNPDVKQIRSQLTCGMTVAQPLTKPTAAAQGLCSPCVAQAACSSRRAVGSGLWVGYYICAGSVVCPAKVVLPSCKQPRVSSCPAPPAERMVGVPRSKGCALCLSRRVKCDEVKPGCGNCLRYGADCPGYDKSRKFVAGKHRIRSKRHTGDQNGSSPSTPDGLSNDQGVTMVLRGGLASQSERSLATRRTPELLQSPRPNRGEFIVTLMQVLRTTHTDSEMVAFGRWFLENPNRMGGKVAYLV